MASFQPNMKDLEDFKKPEEYRLYVTNLPVELSEEGIKEIFDHYGKVIGLFYRPNTTWTFVTYRTYCEAEYALRDLHDKPPLYLKVSFGKEKRSDIRKDENLQDKNSIESYEYPVRDSSYNSKAHIQQSINRGKHISALYKERLASSLPIDRYASDDLLYPVPTDPYTYDPYENVGPYDYRNALWTRGTVTVTRDGKRHVSHGRGYTSYEIPDPHPKIETFINQIHENRLNGLYQHGQDALKHRIGKCIHCTKPANMRCERCYSFYCSRECQVSHWPYHKDNCHKIPALIKNTGSLSTSSNDETSPVSNLPQTQKTLRRPRQAASDALRKNAESVINRNTNITNTDLSREENFQNDHQTKSTTKIDDDLSKLISGKNNTQKKNGKINSSDALQMEKDLLFQKNVFLSTEKFIDVRIVNVVKQGVYWVQRSDQQNAIKKMEKALMQMFFRTAPKVEPVLGKMYAYKCEKSWKRIHVISLNPTKIFFVDYGITMTATDDNFCNINLKYEPPYAVKICLSESAEELFGTLKVNDNIKVRTVNFTEDMIIVDGKWKEANLNKSSNKSESDCTIQSSEKLSVSTKKVTNEGQSKVMSVFITLPNILDHLTENVWGCLDVRTVISKNVYGVAVVPENMSKESSIILHDLKKYCDNSVRISGEKISMGQLLCGYYSVDNCWYRGCVVSLQPIRLALIDETKVISTEEVVSYPNELLNICRFGLCCTITDSNYKFKVDDVCEFKVINCAKEVKIEINTPDEKKIEAVLTLWEPRPEQSGIKYFELKNGSEVCITAYLSQNKLYVRSLQTEDQEKFHKIMQDVAKCAQSAPYLKEPPVVGEMVLAQYTDGNFYRAIVTKVQKDEMTIAYVDYGNGENISWKKLKLLPADLKAHRSCAAKIILKDVPDDIAITKDLSDYFVHLTGREIPLICHFDGIPSKDGVSLIMANGESVNDQVKQLLTPNWKKDSEKDKTVYTVNDIIPAKFGDSNETRAVVLNTVYVGVKYVMCPLDIDLITNVYDVLPGLMNEYCEKAEYYIPRINELCLGLYGGNWYRALCTDNTPNTDKYQLFFLDYGNMEYVSHKQIRAMTKDFLKPSSLSNICTVINLAPKDEEGNISPQVLKRISELITPDENVLIKIVKTDQEGFHTIELPEIHAKLIEEGLI